MSLIQVEITNACNLMCVYCDRKREGTFFTDGRKDVTPVELDHILDELLILPESYRKWRFSFCGLCEPLMNPYFVELISNDKLKNFIVDFVTNGTLLSEELVHKITKANSNLAICVSLQSCQKNIMESMQQGADFNNVIANCKHLITHKQQFRWIRIQSMKCALTKRESQQQFEKALGIKFEDNVLFHRKSGVNITGLANIKKWPKAISGSTCSKYGENIIINCWGDLTACCWDCTRVQAYGNIYQQSLQEIQFGKKKNEMQQILHSGKMGMLPICDICLRRQNES